MHEFIPVINCITVLSLAGIYRQLWTTLSKKGKHRKVIEMSKRIQGVEKQVQDSN